MGTTVNGFTTQVLTSATGRFNRQYRAASTAAIMWMGSGTKAMATPAPNAAVIECRFIDHSSGSVTRVPKIRRYQRRWRVLTQWAICLT